MDCVDLTLDSDDELLDATPPKSFKCPVDDDSDIEFIEVSLKDVVHSKKRASDNRIKTEHSACSSKGPGRNKQPKLSNISSSSSSTRSLAQQSTASYNATAGPSTISEDERLARELQEKERKDYRDLIEGVVNRTEGIVFRTIVNADGTLEDGSPAHPDDLERFEPWKKLFDSTSGGAKIKRFHWIVNYELEKRFEEAKASLRDVEDADDRSQELLLFHGTLPKNIDSILDNGFRIGGIGGHAVVNGTCEGYGVYTTTQAGLSFGHAPGADKIFACRVFPGKITSSLQYSMNAPLTTNPPDEIYQTYSANNGVYVVRYSSLVLPCYMIEFEPALYFNPWLGIGAGLGVLGGAGGMGVGGLGAIAAFAPPPPFLPIAPIKTKRKGKGKTKARAKNEVLGASNGVAPITRSRMKTRGR